MDQRPSFCTGTCRCCDSRTAGKQRPQKNSYPLCYSTACYRSVYWPWFFLNSDVGLGFVKGFSEMFEKLLGFANEGTNFVFGSMNDQGLAFFFLKVLCPIVFISALIGYSPAHSRVAGDHPRNWFPALQSQRPWANWNPLTPSAP